MPLPSYALVRNPANERELVVRINDRGPFKKGRVIDLSRAAARQLGIRGLAKVEVRRLTHDEIRTGAWKLPADATRVAGDNAAAKGTAKVAAKGTASVDTSTSAAGGWDGTRLENEAGPAR
jgi:rare lipoprotein A